MEQSILTKDQKRKIAKDIKYHGKPARIIATVRYDDECNNGHNSFSVTGEIWSEPRGRDMICGGCIHDEIRQHFPELAHLIKWHLCSSDGPMHYVANTTYHASDRDYNGLLAGESRQIVNGKTGKPSWKLEAIDESTGKELRLPQYADGDTPPEGSYSVRWVPLCRIGEGKERDLDAARSAAAWPEATDEELTSPGLKERLEARLPALLKAFRADVEAFGFNW